MKQVATNSEYSLIFYVFEHTTHNFIRHRHMYVTLNMTLSTCVLFLRCLGDVHYISESQMAYKALNE